MGLLLLRHPAPAAGQHAGHQVAALTPGGEDDGQQVQTEIRDNIRRSIQTAVQGAGSVNGSSGTASLDGVRFLVPAGNIAVASSGSSKSLDVGDELKVKLEGGSMWVNGTRYARPAKGSEVDLRTSGTVTVDGKASYP